MAGRVGFGIGLWGDPVSLLSSPNNGVSSNGALQDRGFGSNLDVRWWASERVVLIPSLGLSISRSSDPQHTRRNDVTSGSFEPGLLLGFAAYRGKTTRFIASGGLRFVYVTGQNIFARPNGLVPRYEPTDYDFHDTAAVVSVPAAIALEQFFTSRISIALGAEATVFSYSALTPQDEKTWTVVGAGFDSSRLSASLLFYTD